ncbi:zinc-containing alcohol dehydrogenase, putative [Trichophyton benhamiae CBS 112371]|uniref:Zinc-containing alcohol dehydrogenase, putative n=1 Tax=Arthroderma benhamiae (strain ATCC MYA-4681 / CBS 112371) TaxID=663331 RepID=D4ALU4_ARTBC|nr:zinc-containing alcohol dehydrogenase, putative [Trichophyton benhamiae CBS 112371]EFE36353.1 zinc-containing alcohol dehydrogenase, putative [Trichophyton benhamiae CBS 112371]
MSTPKTTKAYRRSKGSDFKTLEPITEKIPSTLKPQEVLIRIHAVSLNYRDVAMLHGKYPIKFLDRGIPASDCAAEVIAVGSDVKDFEIGDHVAPIFDVKNIHDNEEDKAALGGHIDGVLRQYAVFDRNVLFHLPNYLSWEEVSKALTTKVVNGYIDMPTFHRQHVSPVLVPRHGERYQCLAPRALPCFKVGLPSNTTTLKSSIFLTSLPGTGGVSMFGLLICLAAGIRPIITSSSDEKLDRVRALGKPGEVDTINYRTHPDWENEVLRLTNGRGVDFVIETVGPRTIAQSITSLARRGSITVVGFLGGFDVKSFPDTITPLLTKTATIRGGAVGSKTDHQNLSDFLSEKKIDLKPILDNTVFTFDDSQAAFDYLYDAKHMGKVVIRI